MLFSGAGAGAGVAAAGHRTGSAVPARGSRSIQEPGKP